MTDKQYQQAHKIINDIQKRKLMKEEIFKAERDSTENPQNFYKIIMPGNREEISFRLPGGILAGALKSAQEYLDNDIERLENQFKAL